MNDGNLLIFGCAVSFVALAGVYLFLREAYSRGQKPGERDADARAELKTGVGVQL